MAQRLSDEPRGRDRVEKPIIRLADIVKECRDAEVENEAIM
jgi:hypothetical protein